MRLLILFQSFKYIKTWASYLADKSIWQKKANYKKKKKKAYLVLNLSFSACFPHFFYNGLAKNDERASLCYRK